jgi:predicted glycosyltransferase
MGHEIIITARDKDVTLDLLSLYGISCFLISRKPESIYAMTWELISRNLKMLRLVLKEKPDILVSAGGISTAQVGWLTGTRNLVFADTEHETMVNRITFPFATEVITPACYNRPVKAKCHITYPGYHSLAYLHPNRFTPDPEILRNYNINPEDTFSVVRFVSLKATHDIGATGFTQEEKVQMVRNLERFGKVWVSSETGAPAELESNILRIPVHHIHHLLAFARLYVGESATMASESAVLGTPAVFMDFVGRGYTDEQERKYGLVFNFKPDEVEKVMETSVDIMARDSKGKEVFQNNHAKMLSENIDVTEFIIKRLLDVG